MRSDTDVVTPDFSILAGEKIKIEESNKYSLPESRELWHAAGLSPVTLFANSSNDYRGFFTVLRNLLAVY